MHRRTVLRAGMACGLAAAAPVALHAAEAAVPPEVQAALPGARLQGQGRLRFFGLHIYDARLWVGPDYPREAPASEDFARHPLALELDYARALDGAKIAERAIVEMERVSKLAPAQAEAWLALMKQAFPDVKAGDRITGLQAPGASARFFVNARPSAELRDAEFTQRFFAIWLGPQTSEPKLRAALLGSKP